MGDAMRRCDAFGRYLLVSLFALFAPLDAAHAGFKVVYSFQFGNDGAFPAAGLIGDAAGNYYGTTYEGGSSAACSDFGCGTVFKIAPHHYGTAGASGGNRGEPFGR